MWFRNLIFDIKSWLAINWLLHRRIFIWIGVCAMVGIIIGLITIFNPLITHDKINGSILDANLLRATTTKNGIGAIILARLFEFTTITAFIFLVCLNTYTALFTLAYCGLRTCTIVINIYWIIAKFGIISGLVILLVYIFFLILLLLVYIALAVYMLKTCAQIRRNGFRYAIRWKALWHALLIFALAITIIALLEWLVYILILSKFIFLT